MSLAREYQADSQYTLQSSSRDVRKELSSKNNKRNKKRIKHNKLRMILYIAVFMVTGFVLTSGYTNLYGQHGTINKLETQLARVQSGNDKLKVDIESATKLTDIEKYAVDHLGMRPPQTNQIIYITPGGGDRMKKELASISGDGGFIGFVSSVFNGFIEYFK